MLHLCRESCYLTGMAKNKYSVEFAGVAVTRSTNRTYAFVTVSLGHTLEREASIIAGEIKICDENLAYHRGKLASGDTRWESREQIERDIQRNLERRARLESENPFDRTQQVCEWGWSSRRDLAEKNAAKARDLGYQEVTVLEVPQP
jgi:hypothetical protein